MSKTIGCIGVSMSHPNGMRRRYLLHEGTTAVSRCNERRECAIAPRALDWTCDAIVWLPAG
jgi:hypothetical protein